MKQDMIVILDLGSHENTVVARAIRALGVYSEIYPHDITVDELKALPNVKGIVINGGPNNVVDGVAIDVFPEIYEAFMNYTLDVYMCKGTKAETLEWFKIINTYGERLNDQELLNVNYTGKWLTSAKKYFSKNKIGRE